MSENEWLHRRSRIQNIPYQIMAGMLVVHSVAIFLPIVRAVVQAVLTQAFPHAGYGGDAGLMELDRTQLPPERRLKKLVV